MAVTLKALIKIADTAFYQAGDGFIPSLSGGGKDLILFQGSAQAAQAGRTLTSAVFGTQNFTIDQVGPEIVLLSFRMHHLTLSIRNALIPIENSVLGFTWSNLMENVGSGIGLHLEGVNQTNTFVDQSGTTGIQEEVIVNVEPTDLVVSSPAGGFGVYTLINSTLDPGTIPGWTRVNRGALGGGSTGSSQLDEGATFIKAFVTAVTDESIPSPVGQCSGYANVVVVNPDVAAAPASAVASSVSSAVDISVNSELIGGDSSAQGVAEASPITIHTLLSNGDSVSMGVASSATIGIAQSFSDALGVSAGVSSAADISVTSQLSAAGSFALGIAGSLPIGVADFFRGGSANSVGVASAQDIIPHSVLSNGISISFGVSASGELIALTPNARLRSYSVSRIFHSISSSIN